MTDSPSETTEAVATDEAPDPDNAGNGLGVLGEELAALVDAESWSADFDTLELRIDRANWVGAAAALRDAGLPFLSWISAIDWSRETEVGEPVADPDTLEERYDVLARMSSLTDDRAAILVAAVPKDDARMDSLVSLFGGAGWHERETAEMFGITFDGNPNLAHLYLPDSFEGHPLLKSYPLLSREVKPWPGTVDVEDMPSTENTEAAAQQAATEDGGAS